MLISQEVSSLAPEISPNHRKSPYTGGKKCLENLRFVRPRPAMYMLDTRWKHMHNVLHHWETSVNAKDRVRFAQGGHTMARKPVPIMRQAVATVHIVTLVAFLSMIALIGFRGLT